MTYNASVAQSVFVEVNPRQLLTNEPNCHSKCQRLLCRVPACSMDEVIEIQ